MNKIDLIIKEKRAELNLLQHEMDEALRFAGDRDYEYAALLYPLIGGLEREIEKFVALSQRPDPVSGNGFELHIKKLLSGPFQSLEIWFETQDYWIPQTTRLLMIRKLKKRHRVSCTIEFAKCFEQNLHIESAISMLQHIGWQRIRSGKAFGRKVELRTSTDIDTFCQLMSLTVLEIFRGVWEQGQGQYFRFVE